MRDFSVGFFTDVDTNEAIDRLANADPITIFAGAGVCLDQGIPGWAALVAHLLKLRLSDTELEEAMIEASAEFIVQQYRETSTATIVDAIYREQLGAKASARRVEDIRALLYPGGATAGLSSPSLVERTILLAHALHVAGRDVHVVTTNYDDLFEYAATERSTASAFNKWGVRVVPHFQAVPEPNRVEGILPISHIHGYIPRNGDDGAVPVFSEKDYFEWENNSPFRGYIANRFASGSVLMVGSSLRDANVLRKLRDARNEHVDKYALLPVQSEVATLPSRIRSIINVLAAYAESRGEELGIKVLRPDFFGQVYQFLDEVRAKVSEPRAYVPYVERVDAWTGSWFTSKHDSEDTRRVATMAARSAAKAIRDNAGSVEKTKVELWVRRPNAERCLELWASSQGMWIPGDDHWPKVVPLAGHSRHAVVNCFAMGTTTRGRVAPLDKSRWTHYVATPVSLPGPYASIPVGIAISFFHVPSHVTDDRLPSVEANLDEIARTLLEYGRTQLRLGPNA